jgi:predicted CXXCH cytochrome family protein
MAESPEDPGACTYCHLEAPARDAEVSDLRVRAEQMCKGCHQETPHVGALEHLVQLEPDMVARATAGGLALGPDGKTGCSTCHDVHPAGSTAVSDARRSVLGHPLFPEPWGEQVLVPALTPRLGDAVGDEVLFLEPDYLRRPIALLCGTCHTAAAIEAHRAKEREP